MTTTAEPQLQLDWPPNAAEREHLFPGRSGVFTRAVGDGADSLPALLGWHAATRAAAPALRHKTRGAWTTWSWGDLAHEVACLARGLGGLGFEADDVLALLGQTSARQLVLALAAQARGGAVLPVGDAHQPAGVGAAVRAAEARHVFAFASDERQLDRMLVDRLQLGTVPLAAIVFEDRRGLGAGYSDLPLHAYEAVRSAGGRDSAGRTVDLLESIVPGHLQHGPSCHSEHRALGFWGTGTSGRGHEDGEAGETHGGLCTWLSHRQLLLAASPAFLPAAAAPAGSVGVARPEVAGPEDEALLVDPLWSRSGVAALAHWLLSGSCLSCPETDGSAEEDRREVAPTYLLASRDWYTRLRHDTETRLPPPRSWRRRLIATALGRSARAAAPPSSAARTGILGRQLDHLASVLVARPLARALGLGRARVAVAVGEPLGAEDADFLAAIGIATLHLPS
jgi:long-subunit acyl-CoA synthetase (AMP-forming)